MTADLDHRTEGEMASDPTVLIVKEALNEAVDRLKTKEERSAKKSSCPACGRRLGPFTPGHIYLLIGVAALMLLVIVGAVAK